MKHWALNIRTHYSIGDSLLKVKDAVSVAKERGVETMVLMDTMSISALPDFASRAAGEGIKAVVGCRLRVVDDPTYRLPSKSSGIAALPNTEYFLKVLVAHESGLEILMELLTKANSEEYFYYHARLGLADVKDALERANGSLIVSSGDFYSVFHRDDHTEILRELTTVSRVFVELSPVATPLFDSLNFKAMLAARELNLECIVGYPAFYKTKEDAPALAILDAISQNADINAGWVKRPYIEDFEILDQQSFARKVVARSKAMTARYRDPWIGLVWREAFGNTERLLEGIKYKWEKVPPSLPSMAPDPYAELTAQCKKGFSERFNRETFGHKPTLAQMKADYIPRLNYELSVLKQMGFENYFLLVGDLVSWSKRNGILVGPGRGSVGGSLVAYLIGITDVDPIRFNLLFERFINPERLDLPDADLDFMSTRRHEIVEYLQGKYGEAYVAGISNFNTLASKSALRSTIKAYGMDDAAQNVSKTVPLEHGSPVDLDAACEVVPEIQAFKIKHPDVWKSALAVEGVNRSLGRHAAGIVVGGVPLMQRAVVERRKDGATVNWDKDHVENMGLVKIDVLGLTTLDVIDLALAYIQKLFRVTLDPLALPLDDPKVIAAFAEGRTVGVFQFESGGMRNLLKNLGQSSDFGFEDVTAATALFRPGPMDSGLMQDYIDIKRGYRSIMYDHPNMEPALRATSGVIIYQEQVMQLARDLAGFSLAGADHLRKAMGKKDKEKMAKQREAWVEGCQTHSKMGEREAGALFDKIEKFAGYGFNRSHAIEYTLISYICMYLKVYYPIAFYAGALTVMGEDKLRSLIEDAQEHGISVLPPDINYSSGRFEILNETTLLIPFNRVKAISDNTTNAILAARALAPNGQFTDTAHFQSLVEKRKCNIRHVANLTKVGAFARLERDPIGPKHPDRLKDQIELMPGLIIELLKANRAIDNSKETEDKVKHLVVDWKRCEGCDLAGGVHVLPRMGKAPRFMVVTDCPTGSEEFSGQMTIGKSFTNLHEALQANELDIKDGYFTALVKSPKLSKAGLTPQQITACTPHLLKEIALLKPPVIVALGSATARYFMKGMKGSITDNNGKVAYDAETDSTIIIGISPGMVFHDPGKQEFLNDVFKKVKEIVG